MKAVCESIIGFKSFPPAAAAASLTTKMCGKTSKLKKKCMYVEKRREEFCQKYTQHSLLPHTYDDDHKKHLTI